MNELKVIDTKEVAMQKAGATREESYKAIVRGLNSKKMTIDKFGEEHFEEDTTNQLRSAEIISRMNGDLKPDTVVDNRSVSINMSNVSNEILQGMLDMVKDVKGQLASLRTSGHQTGEIIDVEEISR